MSPIRIEVHFVYLHSEYAGAGPMLWFLIILRLSLHIKQGTFRIVVLSCIPPESVRTTLAEDIRFRKSRYPSGSTSLRCGMALLYQRCVPPWPCLESGHQWCCLDDVGSCATDDNDSHFCLPNTNCQATPRAKSHTTAFLWKRRGSRIKR